MTKFTLKLLADFLNHYQNDIKLPVGDYGGGSVGNKVKKMLAKGGIKDYHILDYTTKVDLLKSIKGKKYGLGICMDLLEHTSQPFIVAETITNSLKKNALLFVTAPFVWELHNYPKDYWRFTDEGLKALFPKLKCLEIVIVRDKMEGNKKVKELVPRTRVVAVFRKM